MDFANERYVRLYTRDTTSWKLLRYEGQVVWTLLYRKADRSGVISLDGIEPWEAAVLHCDIPEDVARVGMERCLDRGWVAHDGDRLLFPKYVAANETPQSDKQRAKESRERRAVASQNVTEPSRDVTSPSHAVTRGHAASRRVTPSVPSRTDPADQILENSPQDLKPHSLLQPLYAQARANGGGSGVIAATGSVSLGMVATATTPAPEPTERQERAAVLTLVPKPAPPTPAPAASGLTRPGVVGLTWLASVVTNGDTFGVKPYDAFPKQYDYIGSRPVSEREAVAKHVRVTTYCLNERGEVDRLKATPLHLYRYWDEYVAGDRNPKLSAAAAASAARDDEVARLTAAKKVRVESGRAAIREAVANRDSYTADRLRAELDALIPKLDAKIAEAREGGRRR